VHAPRPAKEVSAVSERLGKYRLLKRLATGGMAEIWLARQRGVEGFEKLVVVKRILPHLSSNEQFVRMFLDEARLAAQLSHPNIVQIYELGRAEDLYFIAMEFIHGENLRTVSRAAGKSGTALPPEVCAKVISQACEALYYAHTKTDVAGQPLGIVHRDISPQNLLLSFEGQVKVVDFGIAKAATQCEETRTGVLKGKYAYMSPEQCRGDPLDARSDIFALGIVLWELATGTRLYKQSSELMILKAICEDPTPPPTEVRRDIPVELEAIILKALAKDRDRRFQDCHEMHLALEKWLRGRPEPISSMTLSKEMSRLFAEKLAGWQKLIESLDDEDEALESELFDDISDLFESGTPSSHISEARPRTSGGSSSGSRPLIVFDDGTGGSRPRPGLPPSTPPPSRTPPPAVAAPAPPARSGGARALPYVLGVLLLAVSGAFVWQSFFTGPAASEVVQTDPEPTDQGMATVVVESEPDGATVYVDDRARGPAPVTVSDVAVGVATRIRVEAPGYETFVTEIRMDTPGSQRRVSARREARPDSPALLEIRTEPAGARVLVAGEALDGRTPLTVEVGADRVGKPLRIELEGYEPQTRRLDVAPGSRGRWDLSLRPVVAERPQTTRPVRPGTRPTPTKATPEPPGVGKLSITTRGAWCNIAVDGKVLGQTPVVGAEVPSGRRQVVCENPQLGVRRTLTVDVPRDGEVRETINLRMGQLAVRVNPWAEVSVNGRSLGTTPFQPQQLPEGRYTVVLENPNFGFRKEYQVTIRPDATHTITENLLE
jgi:eukaryotic-like serine/threonine-protein kinase